jgi:hypothetical protein
MAPKKAPAKKVATKKVSTKSSVETNRTKTPQAKAAARTDAKGRTGMGSSTASGKKQLPKNFGENTEELRKILLTTLGGNRMLAPKKFGKKNIPIKNKIDSNIKDLLPGDSGPKWKHE